MCLLLSVLCKRIAARASNTKVDRVSEIASVDCSRSLACIDLEVKRSKVGLRVKVRCLSVSVSVCHKSAFYRNGCLDGVGFLAYFHLSYMVL